MRHNLPTFPTPFIGRSDEITELSQLLENPDCRLLTLVGPGGIGKTRLAVEVARCIQNLFSDGIYFVPLQPLQSADQALSTIIDIISINASYKLDRKEHLLQYLNDKRLLLVLDNFEQVVAAAPLISEILTAASEVKVLVTSRTELTLMQEWIRPVGGLTYPKNGLLNDSTPFSAVDLFAYHAQRVSNEFSVEDERSAVIRVCQQVGGLPLALELAAGWRSRMVSEDIAHEVEQDLSILETDASNMPVRHQRMLRVLDRSWQHLNNEEQAVFRKLCIFRGGFKREAAEQVTDSAFDLLGRLARQSWLRMEGRRYQIQEVLRQYGMDHLEEVNEIETTNANHSRYYARFMDGLVADIKGKRQAGALDDIQRDFENIRMAWWWAVNHHAFDDVSRMVEGFYWYFFMRGKLDDYRILFDAFDQLVPLLESQSHPLWARLVVRGPGNFSVEYIKTAIEFAQDRNDLHTAAVGIQVVANTCLGNQSYDEAIELYEDCLQYYLEVNDQYAAGDVYCNLELCYEAAGVWDKAQESGYRSLAITREIGDQKRTGCTLTYMGNAALAAGDYALGHEMLQEGDEILSVLKDIMGTIWSRTGLSFYHWLNGDLDDAQRLLQSAMGDVAYMRWPDGDSEILSMRGLIYCLEERYKEGKHYCELGNAKYRHLKVFQFFGYLGIAIAATGLDDDAPAQEHLVEILRYGHKTDTQGLMTWCLPVAAVLVARQDKFEYASELLGLAFTHPKSATGWMEKWPLLTRLRAQLEAELGTDGYAEAWERGAKKDLITVADKLLSELDSDHQSARERANQALDEPLTKRELNDALPLMARGHSNRQIAEELIISVGTVRRYVHDICQKLDAQNRTHAVARARELGLL